MMLVIGRLGLVHYCTLSLSDIWVTRQECRVGTPYMERNLIDSLPKAKVDQSESSFLQKSICGSWWGKKVPNVTDVCGVYL